jgi:hypothetical protein
MGTYLDDDTFHLRPAFLWRMYRAFSAACAIGITEKRLRAVLIVGRVTVFGVRLFDVQLGVWTWMVVLETNHLDLIVFVWSAVVFWIHGGKRHEEADIA